MFQRRIGALLSSSTNDSAPAAASTDSETRELESAKANRENDESLDADARLVERCIRGEVAGWEELYRKCHDPLCVTIRIRLGRLGSDAQLVDELAARVWYRLIDNDGKQLAKYLFRRMSILSYIRLQARWIISEYFRSERRRMKNELTSLVRKNRKESVAHAESLPLLVTEFLSILTPRERSFCFEYLQISPEDGRVDFVLPYSPENIWQLTRRVYKKFTSFFYRDP